MFCGVFIYRIPNWTLIFLVCVCVLNISVWTVWEYHWVQIAEPSGCQAPLESVCGASHIFQVGGECLGFFLTKLWTVGATCTKGKKSAGKASWKFLFLSSQWSLFLLSVPLPVLCWGRDTVHACHCTHRGQRTTLGIRAHLPLCLIQGLLFTAVHQAGLPCPRSL